MKKYIAPEMDIELFNQNVIMSTSGLDTDIDMDED